jgi:hypothetical protein
MRSPYLPELAEALLIGLAAWRCTALVSYERGPFDVFLKFRKLLGFQHEDSGRPYSWPDGVLQKMIACPWCLGLWVAAGMWGIWQVSHAAVIVLAASAILIAVEQWSNNG